MEVKASCTWGDGPDVLLNIQDTLYDLTSEQAKRLANELLQAAQNADELDSTAKNHDRMSA